MSDVGVQIGCYVHPIFFMLIIVVILKYRPVVTHTDCVVLGQCHQQAKVNLCFCVVTFCYLFY